VRWIYLDNNATTQPAPQVVAAMNEMLGTLWANPSSVHRFGQSVRQKVELARSSVARLINCRDRELIFTSGGTEANNLALRGVLTPGSIPGSTPGTTPGDALLITNKVEHSAIRQPAEFFAEHGVRVVYLSVSRDGLVDVESLRAALRERRAATTLVSVQWANNETGVIQPMAELSRAIREDRETAPPEGDARGRVLFHVDATQAVGKIPVDVKEAGVDLLTLAAHKFHGPKGVGALYARTGVRLRPQQLGGPQECDRRGGTENTPGIVGMGVAADLAVDFLADSQQVERLRGLRDRFEQGVLAACPGCVVNSVGAPRLWNTTNIGFPRLEAEAILLALSEKGVCASAGAACSSGSLEPSPVLLAMGIGEEIAHGSVRFSLGRFTTADEIDEALRAIPAVVERLSRTLPTGANR
jgi:cysteine desulfurase